MNGPCDVDPRIIPTKRTLCFRIIDRAHLVLDNGRITQHTKAMGKSYGNEELAVALIVEFDPFPLPESGGIASDIDPHIKNFPLKTTDEFGLTRI